MRLDPERSACCELGNLAITWRQPHPIVGPEREGWSMVIHIMVGPPEYGNIVVCPFCGHEPLNKTVEKQ